MNTKKEQKHGVAARQQTMDTLNYLIKYYLSALLILPLLSLSSCDKKNVSSEKAAYSSKTIAVADTLYKPKVDIKVNRHYDDKGHLIGFDSTYSSYYSNLSGDTVRMDSLMGSFDRYFKNDHAFFLRDQFDPLFFNDSQRYPDFFHKDFFLKRYELNDRYMRSMMHQMDSIKNGFYQKESKKQKHP